jgi:hypothetical protein
MLAVIIMACVVSQTVAAAEINGDIIAAAQEYGREKASIPLTEFFAPWTVYEEKAAKITPFTDRAFVYTPFLLLAADARDKTQHGQPVRASDSELVLTDYHGFVIFGITVFGHDPALGSKITVTLKQDGKTKKVHSMTTLTAENVQGIAEQRPLYGGQFYAYFLADDVVPEKTAILQVTAGDKRQRKFYFNLSGFK